MNKDYSEQDNTDSQKPGARILSLHPNTGIFLAVVVLNTGLLFAFRLLFLVKYHALFRGVNFADVLLSVLHGLRFDLSVTFLLFALLFIVLFLPGRWVTGSVFRLIARTVIYVVFVLELSVCIIDLVYFGYVHRHLGAEVVNIHHDAWAMVSMTVSSYLLAVILFTACAAVAWYGLKKLFAWLAARVPYRSPEEGISWKQAGRSILYVLVLLIVVTIAVRGGLQLKPLRVAHAFLGDNVMLGQLSLNGVFTVLQAVRKEGIRFDVPCEYDKAVDTVRILLAEEDTEFLDRKYPLLRHHASRSVAGERPNVVIFILESWSADAVGVTGGTFGVTPNFDRLAGQGRLYANFYSVGQRSIDAVVSVFYSFPSFSGCSIVGKAYEQNQMIGLGSILKKQGYSTLFLCGAKRGSMGFDVFAYKAGFNTYIARDDFDLPAECFDGTWGVFDEYAFSRADEEFRKLEEPFLGVVYTLNPHAPYRLPSDRFRKITDSEYAPFLNALYYCDWALGEFFAQARTSAYFDNTLFILVADHPEGQHERSTWDRLRIPCLFLFPAKIRPDIDTRVGTQLDILPTIIDFLDLDCTHASLGVSLFGKGERTALISYGNVFGLFKDRYVLLHTLASRIGVYDYAWDPLFQSDVSGQKVQLVQTYEKELLSILKVATVTLETNTVAPLDHTGGN